LQAYFFQQEKIVKKESVELGRVHLGNRRYAVVSVFDGVTYLSIRQYEEDPITKREYPTTKGAALNPMKFAILAKNMDDIDNEVKTYRTGEGSLYRLHLGGGVFLTLKRGYACVNIRKYFIPTGESHPYPTRKGIALRFDEWAVLLENFSKIKEMSSELANAQDCTYTIDHSYNGFLNCKECMPANWAFIPNDVPFNPAI